MIEWISNWAGGIVVAVIIGTVIEMILPSGNSKKYIKVVIGIYVLFTIVSPVITKFTGETIEVSDILDLDKYVEEADIGVDSLAAFRVHLETTSSLKSREYLCYGLPFITASKVTGIDENLQWIIRMPNDETPLNMNEIIEFYTKIEKYGSVRVAEELHKYAKEHVDAIQTLRCVTEYLDS